MRSRGSLSRKQLLVLLGIATVVFDLVMVYLDRKMTDAGGPSILGFEFAGSGQQAAKVMAEWGAGGRHYARWSLWLDYGFMLSYGSFFALAATATRDFARESDLRRLAAAGAVAPIAAIAAASFDAIENVFLLLTLGGHGGSFGPPIATVCASLKFALIAFAIVYVLWGLAARLFRARRAGQASGA
ncbi:MAG: hypothetical protein ACOYD4_13115 [Solirubrobacterales bacterium]